MREPAGSASPDNAVSQLCRNPRRLGVAALCLGIEREAIVEEYLPSDGNVNRRWIETALDGPDPAVYFKRVDLARIRRKLHGRFGAGARRTARASE